MAKKNSNSFEDSLKELETIVRKMDSGELSLEDSLLAFEKGISLIRHCQTTLQSAEQKVQLLMEQNGELHTADFNDSSEK